jgi:hypothetical protein
MKLPQYKILSNGEPVKVVVDLSFFIQSSTHDLVRWSRLQPLLFPETFFFELFTTSKSRKQQLWAYQKFPHCENLGARLPQVARLLDYERQNKLPAGPVLSSFEAGNYYLNPDLAAGIYQFPDDSKAEIDKWEKKVREQSQKLPHLTKVLLARFPKIVSCPNSHRQKTLSDIIDKVAVDDALIRNIYNDYADAQSRSVAQIDKRWAVFWRIRFLLLICLKHFESYPPNNPIKASPKLLDNEWLDLEYLILGALTGGLASNDGKTIRRFFRLATPKSWLFPH